MKKKHVHHRRLLIKVGFVCSFVLLIFAAKMMTAPFSDYTASGLQHAPPPTPQAPLPKATAGDSFTVQALADATAGTALEDCANPEWVQFSRDMVTVDGTQVVPQWVVAVQNNGNCSRRIYRNSEYTRFAMGASSSDFIDLLAAVSPTDSGRVVDFFTTGRWAGQVGVYLPAVAADPYIYDLDGNNSWTETFEVSGDTPVTPAMDEVIDVPPLTEGSWGFSFDDDQVGDIEDANLQPEFDAFLGEEHGYFTNLEPQSVEGYSAALMTPPVGVTQTYAFTALVDGEWKVLHWTFYGDPTKSATDTAGGNGGSGLGFRPL